MIKLTRDPSLGQPDGLKVIGQVPVRNLWLLMLYASDLFQMQGFSKIAVEENPDDIPDLVAEILAKAVEQRLRRTLTTGFRNRHEAVRRVRGRIDLLTTERRQLLARGSISCRFQELTLDTVRNRFVRAALESISRLVVRKPLAHRCRLLAGALARMGVSTRIPTRTEISSDRIGLNDMPDRFMVAAAKLATDLALPTESSGIHHLAAPDRKIRWLRNLYEKAVGGFYKFVLDRKVWKVVTGERLDWQVDAWTGGMEELLPAMYTDIRIDNVKEGTRLVIDTKFNSIVVKGQFGQQRLRSGYIYQIYAYLRSQTGRGDAMADGAKGLLLHPALGLDLDERMAIQGHEIRFRTIDLTSSATCIRRQLLASVTSSPEPFHESI